MVVSVAGVPLHYSSIYLKSKHLEIALWVHFGITNHTAVVLLRLRMVTPRGVLKIVFPHLQLTDNWWKVYPQFIKTHKGITKAKKKKKKKKTQSASSLKLKIFRHFYLNKTERRRERRRRKRRRQEEGRRRKRKRRKRRRDFSSPKFHSKTLQCGIDL